MRNVLIVDDERAVHRAILSLVDWSVLRLRAPESAFNGVEALRLMEEIRPAIAFVDINMPLMDGLSFLTRATERYPDTRFIIVSGYDSFDYARAALRLNVVDYLLKPIDVDELNAALQKALSQLPAEPEASRTPADIAGEIKRYIDQNYTRNISLDTLAEQFFFSREYIGRVFRAQYGRGVYEYVQQVRMERAMQLLKNAELSLQSIAEHLGYSNANYFSKAFRKYYGKAPSAYRVRSEKSEVPDEILTPHSNT